MGRLRYKVIHNYMYAIDKNTKGRARRCLPYRFKDLSSLCPNISDEQCAAVSPKRVLEYVGELGLSVGDVVTLLVGQRSNHLLQEGERLVDVESLTLNVACGLRRD